MTLFGGSSPLGSTLGGLLSRMGTQAIYPYRNNATLWDNYARDWSTEKDFVKQMLTDTNQGTDEQVILGEEWSDKASFQQVVVSKIHQIKAFVG